MRAVIQRVSHAAVAVDGENVSTIEKGLLILLGVYRDDSERDVKWMVDKVAGLRIFADDGGKMNLSVADVGGQVLLVSQFTLVADLKKGRRPSFEKAMEPGEAKVLCEQVVEGLGRLGLSVQEGVFGASMGVSLLNDGPVTIILDSRC